MKMTLVKLLIITQTLDAITTMIGLNLGAEEMNPLPATIGWPTMLTIKVIVVAALCYLIHKGWVEKLCGEAAGFTRKTLAVLTCMPVVVNGSQLVAHAVLLALHRG